MKFIPFLVLFMMGCNPLMWKAAEDAVVGEVKVAETVMQDISAIQAQNGTTKLPLVNF